MLDLVTRIGKPSPSLAGYQFLFAEEDGGFGGGIVDLAAIMEEFGKALTVRAFV